MLLGLHVKNLALIDEAEIEFGNGLNILTGETGAGKSVLIGSINLALGDKADASVIRDGADFALIEMVFSVDDKETEKKVREMLLEIEDGQLILQRKIMRGRSVCKVCGESVTLKQLRELSHLLINIHGQNDQLSLLSRQSRMQIIDAFEGSKIETEKKKLREVWSAYLEEKKLFEKSDIDERSRAKEIDLITYELNEIDGADLKTGEDAELEALFKKISNSQKIMDGVSEAESILSSGDANILDMAGSALKTLSQALKLDASLENTVKTLEDIESLTEDASRALSDYMSSMDEGTVDPAETERRLNIVNRLKEKYASRGDGIESVLEYADERRKELTRLNDLESFKQETKKRMDEKYAEAVKIADGISSLRSKSAAQLSVSLEKALKQLNFENARFEAVIESNHEKMSADGCDGAEFMICLNPGEKMRPLEKISSGGELSRIMLALKTLQSEKNATLSMIFDEIDSGISGKTAWRISQKLGELAKDRQVICITHLAQIAAMADEHFLIYKDTSSGRSVTDITPLSEDETVKELARLMGTDELSASSLDAAKGMRTEALEFKKEFRH